MYNYSIKCFPHTNDHDFRNINLEHVYHISDVDISTLVNPPCAYFSVEYIDGGIEVFSSVLAHIEEFKQHHNNLKKINDRIKKPFLNNENQIYTINKVYVLQEGTTDIVHRGDVRLKDITYVGYVESGGSHLDNFQIIVAGKGFLIEYESKYMGTEQSRLRYKLITEEREKLVRAWKGI